MTPVAFAEANLELRAPPGCEGEVATLPVRRADGRLVSCWKPTLAELEEIVTTGLVWLSVWGRETQPPVLVTAHKADVI